MTRSLVGVLGGVGPMATAFFMHRIVELTEAATDQDHVNVICFNHAEVPDRTAFILDRTQPNPGPVLADDARRLAAFGAEFLVMPCNTAQYLADEVRSAVDIPYLQITEVTADAVVAGESEIRTVGLLATEGTVAARVYHDVFAARGIDVIAPEPADQRVLNEIIYGQVKAGLPGDIAQLRAVAGRLRDRGAQIMVLGCTELSVVAIENDLDREPEYVDSLSVLAAATIRAAGAQLRSR